MVKEVGRNCYKGSPSLNYHTACCETSPQTKAGSCFLEKASSFFLSHLLGGWRHEHHFHLGEGFSCQRKHAVFINQVLLKAWLTRYGPAIAWRELLGQTSACCPSAVPHGPAMAAAPAAQQHSPRRWDVSPLAAQHVRNNKLLPKQAVAGH